MKSALRTTITILFVFLFTNLISAQQSKPMHAVYFFGNLADVHNYHGFNDALEKELSTCQTPFTIIVNGDLVNEKIEKNSAGESVQRVTSLIDLAERFPNGKLILIPGDRDWNNSKKGGEKSLKNLESLIKGYIKKNDYSQTKWAIKKGCPGPEIFEINEGLVIITINSQWWNHPFDKPKPSDGICDVVTPISLKEELEDAVEENLDKNILIMGHHPIYSLGNYGGYFSVADQFKPFPVLGSFRTAYHANVGGHNDLSNIHLAEFIESMKNLLFFHSNLIFASSHEKNQQIIKADHNFLLNSGAPGKASFAAKDAHTLHSSKTTGIMAINYFDDGKVSSSLLKLNPQDNTFSNKETHTLFNSLCETASISDNNTLTNTSYVPCQSKDKASQKMSGNYPPTVSVKAGKEYGASGWKRIWFGNHYRSTWTTPVEVPYLNLDDTFGGLNIYKKGGGRQTTSLKFKSGNGTEYTFRSVNKDPSKALNYKLRPTFVSAVLRDQTTAQQPFGAIAVAPLLDKIDILHASPKLYILPDDKKLGPFQSKYGNLFGMLEENPGKPNNEGKLFGGADKIVRSSKLFKDFYKKQKRKVNQSEFVRARLFDILVGDWSKHEDNWKWAAYDQEDGWRIYRPIPRDRDHVFSRQDGILPWLADRRFAIAAIEHFGKDVKDIQSLTWQARHMDRFIATEVTKEMFLEEAKFIQASISSEDIENAIRQMPPEVYEKSGKKIEAKLKSRIKNLDKSALRYYKLLAKEVEVLGSTQSEFFEIVYEDNGNVDVKSYNSKDYKKGNTLLYHRNFLPNETKAIRVYGLGGDDVFDIKGKNSKPKIKVSTFGGPGDDQFMDAASAKTSLYDKGKGTKYDINGRAKVVNHWNKDIYEYDFDRLEYNHHIPIIYVGYSGFTGFEVNLGRILTYKKFGKDEYASRHFIRFGYTTNNNITASYKARFHHTFKKWDLRVRGRYADSDFFNYFYGVGNSSVKTDSLFDSGFYEARVAKGLFSIGLVKDFWKKSSFSINTGIEHNDSKRIDNTFLDKSENDIFGAHEKFTILPFSTQLDLDLRDNSSLPDRGTRALLTYHNGTIVSANSENYGLAEGSIEYYMSTRNKHPLTLGLRVGGAYGHGDIPWYKLPTLGDSNGLRGYFQNRFAGESTAYANFELRYQIFKGYTSIVPIKIGIKTFYDTGRVFYDGIGEDKSWRYGYGAGFYIVPLNEALTISIAVSFSDEESIYPVISIGTPLQ